MKLLSCNYHSILTEYHLKDQKSECHQTRCHVDADGNATNSLNSLHLLGEIGGKQLSHSVDDLFP